MRRRATRLPSRSDACREDVGLMLALKTGLPGKRGDAFRLAVERFRAQVELVNQRWTQAEIAAVLSNPRRAAAQYAERHLDINLLGAARMREWASRLPEREEF